MLASTLDSIVQKVLILHSTAGFLSVAEPRLVNVYPTGMSVLFSCSLFSVPSSVRIDVDQLLRDRQAEAGMPIYEEEPEAVPMYERARSSSKKPAFLSVVIPARPNKRPLDEFPPPIDLPKPKKAKTSPPSKSKASTSKSTSTAPKIMLKIGPRPELEHYPCCLCVATSTEGLLRVMDPPYQRKEALEAAGNPAQWLAHRTCADVVPETWVDELDLEDGSKESVIYGVDGIVKDRWNLVSFLGFLVLSSTDFRRRNALLAPRLDQRLTGHRSSVRKGSARRPFMYPARGVARSKGSSSTC